MRRYVYNGPKINLMLADVKSMDFHEYTRKTISAFSFPVTTFWSQNYFTTHYSVRVTSHKI